jgi:hypothetical protein
VGSSADKRYRSVEDWFLIALPAKPGFADASSLFARMGSRIDRPKVATKRVTHPKGGDSSLERRMARAKVPAPFHLLDNGLSEQRITREKIEFVSLGI